MNNTLTAPKYRLVQECHDNAEEDLDNSVPSTNVIKGHRVVKPLGEQSIR